MIQMEYNEKKKQYPIQIRFVTANKNRIPSSFRAQLCADCTFEIHNSLAIEPRYFVECLAVGRLRDHQFISTTIEIVGDSDACSISLSSRTVRRRTATGRFHFSICILFRQPSLMFSTCSLVSVCLCVLNTLS